MTSTSQHTSTSPEDLRQQLVTKIESLGTFRTQAVREAFGRVPRHLFLPGVDLPTAYAPRQVVTKRGADGTATSSASSPNIVATMLEQLAAEPGQQILEIGAATGINAALLSEIVDSDGQVITIELDQDLADGARVHLAEAGYANVVVHCHDGALGAPEHAPYDRIIATAGAWDIPAPWWQQLTGSGRLVIPLRLHAAGLTRSLAFQRTAAGEMVATDAATCGFVPMRGLTEMGEHHIRLAADAILKIDTTDLPDDDALTDVLTQPGHTHWTGIHVRHDEPAAHLDLWLATHTDDLHFGKLSLSDEARRTGLATPARRWSGAALYSPDTLTYLTARPLDDDTDELGITTHGARPDAITTDTVELLNTWANTRPAAPTVVARPATQAPPQGWQVHRPETNLAITW